MIEIEIWEKLIDNCYDWEKVVKMGLKLTNYYWS